MRILSMAGKKDDASKAFAAAAIAAGATRREHSDRRSQSWNEKRGAKIGEHARAVALGGRAIIGGTRAGVSGRRQRVALPSTAIAFIDAIKASMNWRGVSAWNSAVRVTSSATMRAS